jgi:hypothetical protein
LLSKCVVAASVAIGLFNLLSSAVAQTCRWAGTAPFCAGACSANEQELDRLDAIPDFWAPPFVNVNPPFGSNCFTGTKAYCCSGAGAASGAGCHWSGTAPFCAGACGDNEVRTNPPAGSSSGASCITGHKVYCCPRYASVGQGLAARDCSYGPGTCAQGYVWRGVRDDDHVCVTPQMRDQISSDNAQAAARRSPTGGPFGPDTCRQGFVWRGAFPEDHVCVELRTREQVEQDNRWAAARNACP